MPLPGPRQELEELVLEQIWMFNQPAKMSDAEILEYHLRHHRILALYGEVDRIARTEAEAKATLLNELLEELVTLCSAETAGSRPGPSE